MGLCFTLCAGGSSTVDDDDGDGDRDDAQTVVMRGVQKKHLGLDLGTVKC